MLPAGALPTPGRAARSEWKDRGMGRGRERGMKGGKEREVGGEEGRSWREEGRE